MRLLQWLLFLVVAGFLLSEKYAPIFFFVGVVIALFLIGTLFSKRIERAFLARIAQAGGNPDTLSGQALYEGLKYEYALWPPLGRFEGYSFTLQVITQKSGSFRVSRKNWIVHSNQTRAVFTGDSAFDHDVMIESETPEYASAIFNVPENRAAIRNIMAHGYTSIEQVGTKLKAIFNRLETDDPCSDIVTSVIPRLALLGGVDHNTLATTLNQSEYDSSITTSGVVIEKKNWKIACVACFFYGSGFFYIGWRYGLLATVAVILFMTAIVQSQLPIEYSMLGMASLLVAFQWTSYTVCTIRNNLIDTHSKSICHLDSFRYAVFAVTHLCVEVATASAVAAWFAFGGIIFANDSLSGGSVFLIYIVFGTGVAWVAELTFGMLALLIERRIGGDMMNPFLEPLVASRLYRGFQENELTAQAFVPSLKNIMRAIGMMVSVMVAAALMAI